MLHTRLSSSNFHRYKTVYSIYQHWHYCLLYRLFHNTFRCLFFGLLVFVAWKNSNLKLYCFLFHKTLIKSFAFSLWKLLCFRDKFLWRDIKMHHLLVSKGCHGNYRDKANCPFLWKILESGGEQLFDKNHVSVNDAATYRSKQVFPLFLPGKAVSKHQLI